MATLNEFKNQGATINSDRAALLNAHRSNIVVLGHQIQVAAVENTPGNVDVRMTLVQGAKSIGQGTMKEISSLPPDVLRAVADAIEKIQSWKTGTQPWPF